MIYINLIALLMVILSFLAYYIVRKDYLDTNNIGKKSLLTNEIIVMSFLIMGLLIRFICGYHYKGHSDISCFTYWSNLMAESGCSKFYNSASFADYPPGYMYILWCIAKLKRLMGIEDGSMMATFLIKLPAILADVATAGIIYKIAKKYNSGKNALICFMLYFFNPVVILNSSVWGQVDSVFSIGIILMCYFIYTGKSEWSYIAYIIAILIKPQAIMFTPILMFSFFEESFIIKKENKWTLGFNLKSFLIQVGSLLGALVVGVLCVLPFGLKTVFKVYTSTMGSYKYASVNAYNMWAMFGLSWVPQTDMALGLTYEQWGTIFIVAIVFMATLIWLIRKDDKERYFVCAIFIVVAMFAISVRMHERYVYPAIILLLILFVVNNSKQIHSKIFWFYIAFSVVNFYNTAHALFFYDAEKFDKRNVIIIVLSMMYCLVFGFFVKFCCKYYIKDNKFKLFESRESENGGSKGEVFEEGKSSNEGEKNITLTTDKKENLVSNDETKDENDDIKEIVFKKEEKKEISEKKGWFDVSTIKKSKVFSKIALIDIIIILVITGVYSIFALRDLGDKTAPYNFYEADDSDFSHITITVNQEKKVNEIDFYLGNYEERSFAIFVSENGTEWIKLENSQYVNDNGEAEPAVYKMTSVFSWNKWIIGDEIRNKQKENGKQNKNIRYIQLVSLEKKFVIGEMALKDKDGNFIEPENVSDDRKDKARIDGKTEEEIVDTTEALFDEQDKVPEEFSFRNGTYFDEIYHARSAYEFIKGIPCYEWTHPPLGKFFISLGMRVFGVCPFGWRIVGTIFGILMVPIIYLFAKRLFDKTFLATIACILLSFDFMHFAQTRIATIDVFVTFFIILMYYFMYRYSVMSFYDKELKKTFIPLLCCGIVTGLGIASKWTGVYAAAGLAVIFFIVMFKRYKEYKYALGNPEGETNGIKHEHVINVFSRNCKLTILFCVGAFVVIPFIIYTLAYIPFVPYEGEPTGLINRMLYNQMKMFNYHSNIVFEHPFASSWYEWPLMIRPIYYYSGILDGNIREGISAFGNPMVWWIGMPAFVYVVYRYIIKKDKKALFLGIGYLAQLLPWILVKRLTFIYHYFPSVPFVVLMIVFSVYRFIQENRESEKTLKIATVIYAVMVVGLFVLFYPVLSGQPVDKTFVSTWLRWMGTWVLVS